MENKISNLINGVKTRALMYSLVAIVGFTSCNDDRASCSNESLERSIDYEGQINGRKITAEEIMVYDSRELKRTSYNVTKHFEDAKVVYGDFENDGTLDRLSITEDKTTNHYSEGPLFDFAKIDYLNLRKQIEEAKLQPSSFESYMIDKYLR